MHRIALVIGNSSYAGPWPDLHGGPLQDARKMRAVLGDRLGFELIYREDADLRQMEDALHEFRLLLQQHPGALALLYYSGHGTQAPLRTDSGSIGTENYLVPAHTDLIDEADASYKAIGQARIEDLIRGAGAYAGVIILDACRDNNLQRGTRGAERGLASRAITDTDLLVVYSATSGKWAYNTDGQASEFTTILAEEIQRPGQLMDALYRVRKRVVETTRSRERGPQEPQMLSSLSHPLYLMGGSPDTGATAAAGSSSSPARSSGLPADKAAPRAAGTPAWAFDVTDRSRSVPVEVDIAPMDPTTSNRILAFLGASRRAGEAPAAANRLAILEVTFSVGEMPGCDTARIAVLRYSLSRGGAAAAVGGTSTGGACLLTAPDEESAALASIRSVVTQLKGQISRLATVN